MAACVGSSCISPPLPWDRQHARDAASASRGVATLAMRLRAETWRCAFPVSFSVRRTLCGSGRRQHTGLYLLASRFSALHLESDMWTDETDEAKMHVQQVS